MDTLAWILMWLLYGFVNWCAVLGDNRLSGESRDHYGMAAFFGLLGPCGTIMLLFLTNFFQRGFKVK